MIAFRLRSIIASNYGYEEVNLKKSVYRSTVNLRVVITVICGQILFLYEEIHLQLPSQKNENNFHHFNILTKNYNFFV
jgi:hypothetical protein